MASSSVVVVQVLVWSALVLAVAANNVTESPTAAPETHAEDHVLIWGFDHATSVWIRCALATLCVFVSGLTGGLTLSIFSLTKEELDSMALVASTRYRARRLLRLQQHEHWVLVTLLLCDCSGFEGLPLVLEPLLTATVTQILLPTMLILIFAGILPESIFVRFAFPISAALVPFVWTAMVVTSPISYPIGRLLDRLVGHRSLRTFRRMELKQLVYENLARSGLLPASSTQSQRQRIGSQHWSSRRGSGAPDGDLTVDEARLILGALSISEAQVGQHMKPLAQCVWITPETKFTPAVVEVIEKAGYSRIPVLSHAAPNTLRPAGAPAVGRKPAAFFILAKDLVPLVHRAADEEPLTPTDLVSYDAVQCRPSDTILELYLRFLQEKRHMALVFSDDGEPEGLVTYSDVMGILTQTQFLDEADLARELPTLRLGRSTGQHSRSVSMGATPFAKSPSTRSLSFAENKRRASERAALLERVSPPPMSDPLRFY